MKVNSIVVAALITAAPIMVRASILGFTQVKIDLTDAQDSAKKAKWARPEKIFISSGGLGWDGPPNAERDGWIQTEPVAIGYSWRTPESMSVRVIIRPAPKEETLSNGQKYIPYPGAAYVRYSPDLAHWSSWQLLQNSEARSDDEKADPGLFREGRIGVPAKERQHYAELLNEYSRLEVPWGSDEEAAVAWMLKREPDFFSKQLPFIGYVQVLYERPFVAGARIKELRADITWGMGGMAQPARDPKAEKDRSTPWRFTSKH